MKTVLITGGTSGIGMATARYLKEQGYRVLVTGRNAQRLQSVAMALEVEPVLCDAAEPDQIKAMGQALQRDGVQLDALLLNAGVFYPALAELDTQENVDITLRTNFVGPLVTVQTLLPILKSPCSIVYVSSIAVTKAAQNCAVYAASKAAFEAAAQVMNLELANRGIRINSVRPGITRTEIQTKAGMSAAAIEQLDASLAAIPLGRMLTPEEIVPSIALLLSEQSLGMRSATLEIDGGFAL